MKHLATRLRLLRYDLNLSQSDLAAALEELLNHPFCQSTVSRLESGKGVWTLELLQALVRFSGKPMSYWLDD